MSPRAAWRLESLGFKDVSDYVDGKLDWMAAGLPMEGTNAERLRAAEAARTAVSSPLLEASIEGARGILLNIAGGRDLTLFEVNEAAAIIHDAAHPDANIIFGNVIDESLGDQVRVTVIAAGFDRFDDQSEELPRRPGRPARRRRARLRRARRAARGLRRRARARPCLLYSSPSP